jgi:hypothetical protein
VSGDGPDQLLFTALDNLIAQHRAPVKIAISIGNGSGDAQGSKHGLECDTVSGRYAEFVETETLPITRYSNGNKMVLVIAAGPIRSRKLQPEDYRFVFLPIFKSS